MGPTSSAPCRVCGCRVAKDTARAFAPLLLVWAPLLTIVPLGALGLVSAPLLGVALWCVCLILAGLLNLGWVPLTPGEAASRPTIDAGLARIAMQKAERDRR
jgi:hypothetical protein